MEEILEIVKNNLSKSRSMEAFSFEDKRDSYWFNNDFGFIRLKDNIIVHVYRGSIDVSQGIKRVEVLKQQIVKLLSDYGKNKDIKPFKSILA